ENFRPGISADRADSEYIEGVLKRVMVVMLLGCVGLTAGVALGTLFSGHEVMHTGVPLNYFGVPMGHVHPGTVGGPPIGGYVLLGLLAGLSAALGFLVPRKSRVTASH